MGEQDLLELGGRDLVALVLDQLLDPVGDPEPAVGVDGDDVAGVHPPAGVDGRRGRRGIIEVAAHRAGGPDEQLPRFAGTQIGVRLGVHDPALDARERGADRIGPVRAVVGGQVGSAGELGQPVSLRDPAADPLRAGAGQAGAQRRGARRQHPQAGQIVAAGQFAVRQRQHDRRHHRGPGHAVVGDGAQERARLEPRKENHGRALDQRKVERHLQTEDVKQRQPRDHHVVFGHARHEPQLAQAGDQVAVSQHHVFGQPGGSARGRQKRDIGGAQGRLRGPGLAASPEHLEPPCARCRLGAGADHEGPGDSRLPGRRPELRREQAGGRDQPARPRLAQLVNDLPARCDGVDRREDRAGRRRGIPGHRELDAVRRAQGQHVARTHALGREPRPGPPDRRGELCVGQLTPGARLNQGPLAATLARLAEHEPGQCRIRDDRRIQPAARGASRRGVGLCRGICVHAYRGKPAFFDVTST